MMVTQGVELDKQVLVNLRELNRFLMDRDTLHQYQVLESSPPPPPPLPLTTSTITATTTTSTTTTTTTTTTTLTF